jgi:hypothetical protein
MIVATAFRLRNKSVALNEQHTELEQTLNKEIGRPMPDAEVVKKIKYQKLAIKDELSKLDGQ